MQQGKLSLLFRLPNTPVRQSEQNNIHLSLPGSERTKLGALLL